MNKFEIAEAINNIRIERGLSKYELSLLSDLDTKQISLLTSTDTHKGYNIETLIRLLNALNIKIQFIEEVNTPCN